MTEGPALFKIPPSDTVRELLGPFSPKKKPDDAVPLRIETGGLEVEGDVLHGLAPILSIGGGEPDYCAPDERVGRKRHTSASLLPQAVPRLGLE